MLKEFSIRKYRQHITMTCAFVAGSIARMFSIADGITTRTAKMLMSPLLDDTFHYYLLNLYVEN